MENLNKRTVSQASLAIHYKWKSEMLEAQLISMTDALLSMQIEAENLQLEIDAIKEKQREQLDGSST